MKAIEQVSGVQLRALVESGLSVEDAAISLDLDPEAAIDYINGFYSQREVTVEELIKKYKPQMIEVLASIALDSTLENISARVAAAKVFVEGKGETPELPVDKLSEAYKKMRTVIEKQQNSKVTTITNPSPSTSIINVGVTAGVAGKPLAGDSTKSKESSATLTPPTHNNLA